MQSCHDCQIRLLANEGESIYGRTKDRSGSSPPRRIVSACIAGPPDKQGFLMTRFSRILFALPVLFMVSGAQAALVEWTLTDVAFDDGGLAIGSFVFDTESADIIALDIQTTMGGDPPPLEIESVADYLQAVVVLCSPLGPLSQHWLGSYR